MLVNAVLSAGCMSDRMIANRAQFWNPHSLPYKFLAEAKRLWELNQGTNELTAIQAAIIINFLYDASGMDRVGLSYGIQAIAMAHDLGIFEDSPYKKQEKAQRASFHSVGSFLLPGVKWRPTTSSAHLFSRTPPRVPLPDPSTDPSWYGEFWIRYYEDSALYPVSFPYFFSSLCGLRIIVNDITERLYGKLESHGQLSLSEAERFKSRFDEWFGALPEPLTPRNSVLPMHLKLHLEYFSTTASIFTPHAAAHAILSDTGKCTELAIDNTAQDIIFNAKIRMETLIRLYYLRHSLDAFDPFMLSFLILLGNAASEALNRSEEIISTPDDLRSTLILCVKGLHDQRKNYYLAEVVYRLLRDRMKPDDVALLQEATNTGSAEDDPPLLKHYIRSQWPIPIIRVDEDPNLSKLDVLVNAYTKTSQGVASDESSRGGTP
ncbi:hypothetical protein NA57DRAFT_53225 [Rhizodiscina lignyota]|uniref:Transcription factor domain-containing protein n=1 Tax=Rhizodiscina lignyota TaxID=1504668 RepID=A0A9P4IL55_9PEZI|nr:hypothetical protein NA57DRAFT_53225 [Rhizodiscina lignyota]